MFALYQILTVVILMGITILFYNRSKKKAQYLATIKGPTPNFLFGNSLDFLNLDTVQFFDQLLKYHDVFGKIIKAQIGAFNHIVIVKDPKFVEYILSSTKLIDKAREYDYLHNWLGTGLLTSTGSKWKQRRRLLTPSFHFSILEQFIEIFESVGDVFINKLENHVGKVSFDVYPLISLYTLDVICEAAMGTSVNAQNNSQSEYVKKVKIMCELVPQRTLTPISDLFYPLRKMCYEEKSALKLLHNYTDSVIDARIKSKQHKEENKSIDDDIGIKKRLAFLDLLLEARVNGEQLSRKDIREEVDTFMFEGHDTTSSAIGFALYMLAQHPEIQEKVFEEQLKVIEDFNCKLTSQHLNQMKYLELVIKETLRLYPSVPIYAREVMEEFNYDGSIYPKNLSIFIFALAMHRDPDIYPDPEKFIPERFDLSDKDKNPFQYVPFSAGPRNCIGQKFAMYEMKSTLSKIVRNFIISPAKPNPPLRLACETILIAKNGIHISLSKRQKQ